MHSTESDPASTPQNPPGSRRPGAADWALRYLSGTTGWDIGRPHPELIHRMADLGEPGRAVVPGAGRGHDAGGLADHGWAVTAIDLVEALSDTLSVAVGASGDVFIGDALSWVPHERLDLVFDHTFFCAIGPERRSDFGGWVARVLRPGGLLASVVFPIGKPLEDGGPPFGVSVADLAGAVPGFDLVTDVAAQYPGRRAWSTRWAVLRAPQR